MSLYNQDQIVTSTKIELKPLFVETYKELLKDRYDEFIKFSFTYLRKCIRVNTLKITIKELKERLEAQGWVLKQVPWCKEGFFIQGHKTEHRFDVGNLIEHTLGYFYVQEASSMIPPVAMFQGMKIDESSKILDLCAAPGSKTTQIAQYMNNEGVLFANDVDVSRLKPLTLNLQRMGIHNTLITHNGMNRLFANDKFKREQTDFDGILVDAPCSGTGTIRKSFKVLEMYSKSIIHRMVKIQRKLIRDSFELLKPGGVLIYSTCTQEPEENEGIVSHLLDTFPDAKIEKIELDINKSEPVLEWKGHTYREELKDAIRIYPMDNDSEGFFICKIRKQ